ncbi:hypothetical protein [Peribacillus frigoritolerans]|uniref:hypothetical protein n=1 Tax=Peribacillus frigoritolerans TaxID=450367 RepID=UPI00399D3CBC
MDGLSRKGRHPTQISIITQDTIPFFQEDSFVTHCILDDIYNAATVYKDKLIIPGAEHCEAEVVDLE